MMYKDMKLQLTPKKERKKDTDKGKNEIKRKKEKKISSLQIPKQGCKHNELHSYNP